MAYLPERAMTQTTELAATVSSKGQVVIPGAVRRRLGLAQGSVLRFVVDADGVRLEAAVGDVRTLKGRLARPAQAVSVQDMDEAIAERRAARAKR
jgi:AbrB family looped-hinge helix DNA binding protein